MVNIDCTYPLSYFTAIFFQELILAFGEINKEAAVRVVESMENKLHLEKLDLNGKNPKHCLKSPILVRCLR